MRVKAIANGNVVDLPESVAVPLVRAGVYLAYPTKEMEADPDTSEEDEDEDEPKSDEPDQPEPSRRKRYRRRDMRPEP